MMIFAVMDVKTISELTVLDRRTASFGPHGLMSGYQMRQEACARFIQGMVAGLDLRPGIPDDVRGYFEIARKLFVYGLFVYEFFTLASNRALFACELALRTRFLQEYQRRVPLVNKKKASREALDIDSWDRLARACRRGWRLEGHPQFDAGLRSLFDWARDVGLLSDHYGPEMTKVIADLRNFGAHPSHNRIIMPADAARMIERAARLINELWDEEVAS